ncbi:MAG: metallophosphoesterase [Saprospiraceae bacterium]
MKKHFLKISSFLLLLSLQLTGQKTIFPFGSNWKYYDKANEPDSVKNKNWYELGYDDSSWYKGPAQLGYGEKDQKTKLNKEAITVYFRRCIHLKKKENYEALFAELIYDDGAVIYLNGKEVHRVNMPSGEITYETFSVTNPGDNVKTSFSLENLLVKGRNTIAVELHQRSHSSSDLSFDLKLFSKDILIHKGSGKTSVQEIVRGPYLQKATSKSIVVKWKTKKINASFIHYGLHPDSLVYTFFDEVESKNHEVEITDLKADTKYYYSIPDGYSINVDLKNDLYFKTHPEIGKSKKLSAWILGDCGSKDKHQRAVRDAFLNYKDKEELDMLLFLGDNAYPVGTQRDYQDALFEDMYEETLKNTTAWSTFGNHDSYSANSKNQLGPYYEIFTFPKKGESGGVASGTEAYYSFDHGNVHFIVLDSEGSDKGIGEPMYQWCEKDIQNTLADWIVAFWHHPPYSKGSHDSDNAKKLRKMRSNFVPMLERNGVDLVLSGHSHSYERSYLLNGHYDKSYTFDKEKHTVGQKGSGDGQKDGDGAYAKKTTGERAGDGAIYIVAGSAGKLASSTLDHKAMAVSLKKRGSCLLEIEDDELNLKFVAKDGTVEDYFTLRKKFDRNTEDD